MIEHYGKLIFLDLETTGPNPASDLITEIGIVQVSASGVTRWSTLVNPETPIPPFIQRLTGITDAMVAQAPTFSMVAEELFERLQDGLLIAHNARFDYAFLRNAYKRMGNAFRCEVLCTVKLSRSLFPEEHKHGLDALIARHNLNAVSRHRAPADADTLWQFWRKLEAQIRPDALLASVQQLLRRPALPPHLPPELLDDLPDAPGAYVFYGENDVPLYAGRGLQLRARVMAHFAGGRDPRLAQDVRRLEWRETAGEIGAMLLEAQWKQRLHPRLNRGVDLGQPCAWRLHPPAEDILRATLVYAHDEDFDQAGRLYGPFRAREKAETALCALAASLGVNATLIEPGHVALGATDAVRMEAAMSSLAIDAWPYADVAILEEFGVEGRRALHVAHNWRWLGSAGSEEEARRLLAQAAPRLPFDIDSYRILVRGLSSGRLQLVELGEGKGEG